MPDPTPYEVFAIRYATVARKSAENFIGGDAHESGARMDYFVWLVRNAERTYVVDTGFNEAAAAKRKREFLRSPAEGLRLLGVDAATVENVIITHLHYDHVGNFDLFPKARFHLQDRELAFATGRYMAHEFFSYAYELEEVLAMVRNAYAGRIDFHDGDEEIAPGLSLHHIGGHTKGLQVVRVWTAARVARARVRRQPLLREHDRSAALPGRRQRYGNGGWLEARARAREQPAIRDPRALTRW